jgi:hypothetical protein
MEWTFYYNQRMGVSESGCNLKSKAISNDALHVERGNEHLTGLLKAVQ